MTEMVEKAEDEGRPGGERRRPGRVWYAVAALLPVIGLGAAIGLVFLGVDAVADGLQPVVVPGSATVTIDQPGTHTIFHEDPSVVKGHVYSSGPLRGLQVTVTGPDGESLPVYSPRSMLTYTAGGRSGTSVLAFDARRPGPHRVEAGYAAAGPRAVLAVGSSVGGQLAATALLAVGLPLAGLALGLVVGVVTFVRRRRTSG